jgi:hypothetical protein
MSLVLFGLPAVCAVVWLAVRLRARRKSAAASKTQSTDGGGGPGEEP